MASQWATDIRTERRQAYDPYPVDDWFAVYGTCRECKARNVPVTDDNLCTPCELADLDF